MSNRGLKTGAMALLMTGLSLAAVGCGPRLQAPAIPAIPAAPALPADPAAAAAALPAGTPAIPGLPAQPIPGGTGAGGTPIIPIPPEIAGQLPAGINIPTIPQLPPGITPAQAGLPPGVTFPQPPPTGPIDASFSPGQPTVSGAAGQEMDAAVAAFSQREGGYCGTVTVAKEGRILLNKGYGIADTANGQTMPHNALWDWASVGKQFTAAAVLKARMEGQGTILDDSVRRFYPNAPADKQPVLMRHLLSHSSGILREAVPNLMGTLGRDPFVADFLNRQVVAPAGTKYEYSPATSFNVAAACLEVATGQDFERYMATKIWAPAGMRETWFMGNPAIDQRRVPKSEKGTGPRFVGGGFYTWHYRGSGGVVTSGRDLVAWDLALRGETVLNAEAKENLYRVQIDNYALGWQIGTNGTETTYTHAGNNGVGTYRYYRTKNSKVCIAFASSAARLQDAGSLINQLAAIAERPGI